MATTHIIIEKAEISKTLNICANVWCSMGDTELFEALEKVLVWTPVDDIGVKMDVSAARTARDRATALYDEFRDNRVTSSNDGGQFSFSYTDYTFTTSFTAHVGREVSVEVTSSGTTITVDFKGSSKGSAGRLIDFLAEAGIEFSTKIDAGEIKAGLRASVHRLFEIAGEAKSIKDYSLPSEIFGFVVRAKLASFIGFNNVQFEIETQDPRGERVGQSYYDVATLRLSFGSIHLPVPLLSSDGASVFHKRALYVDSQSHNREQRSAKPGELAGLQKEAKEIMRALCSYEIPNWFSWDVTTDQREIDQDVERETNRLLVEASDFILEQKEDQSAAA